MNDIVTARDAQVPVPPGPYVARIVICTPAGEELWWVRVASLVRPGDTITYRVPETFEVTNA